MRFAVPTGHTTFGLRFYEENTTLHSGRITWEFSRMLFAEKPRAYSIPVEHFISIITMCTALSLEYKSRGRNLACFFT